MREAGSQGGLSEIAAPDSAPRRRVSVIIPARNAECMIARAVGGVLEQRCREEVDIEVIVVDDGSVDETAKVAEVAGARVVLNGSHDGRGNPAKARNRGAAEATGDPIIFLDADCAPVAGWLEALLAAHAAGAVCVGGALAMPPGLPASARWDYYCSEYHVHPRRPAGFVPNHTPANLSVNRTVFQGTCGFNERHPIAYSREEIEWQGELLRSGRRIYFEPRAVVYHWNRPGLRNLAYRNYRTAYTAIESKARSGAARLAWQYRYPRLLMATSIPLAPVVAVYIVATWVRAGIWEPLFVFPIVLAARFVYAAGTITGGLRWLRIRREIPSIEAPRGI